MICTMQNAGLAFSLYFVFTAQRYASTVCAMALCLSVCLSHVGLHLALIVFLNFSTQSGSVLRHRFSIHRGIADSSR